jgi:hypothetical protein
MDGDDCRRGEDTGKYSKIHGARVRHTIRRCDGRDQFLLGDHDDNTSTRCIVDTPRERNWRNTVHWGIDDERFGHVRVADNAVAARYARIRQELAREMRRFIERLSMPALIEAIVRPTEASTRIEELRYVIPLDHDQETGDTLVSWCLSRTIQQLCPLPCVCALTENDRAAILSGPHIARALEEFIDTYGATTMTFLTEREARHYVYKHTWKSSQQRDKMRDSGVRRCHARSNVLHDDEDC